MKTSHLCWHFIVVSTIGVAILIVIVCIPFYKRWSVYCSTLNSNTVITSLLTDHGYAIAIYAFFSNYTSCQNLQSVAVVHLGDLQDCMKIV